MKKLVFYVKRVFGMDYKTMFKTINKVHKRSGKSRIFIFFDMINCSIKYLAGYTDYFLFYFENLNAKQRATYITRGVNDRYIRALNDRAYYDYFWNKVKFNKTFKEFIGRDFLDLSKSSFKKFDEFVKKHPIIMAKPIDESGGKGIFKLNMKGMDTKQVFKELKETGRTLIEEYVVQHDTMNKLCASSVNTLRIVTIRKDNHTNIMMRVIRMGDGNHDVDNFHSGGMYSFFDEKGVIMYPAIDREGHSHLVHPATKTKIKGFKIPYYKEAINLAIKASEKIPQIGYIGFDIAITKNGPILIEGNELPGYDLYQSKVHMSKNKEGKKPEFDAIIYKKN